MLVKLKDIKRIKAIFVILNYGRENRYTPYGGKFACMLGINICLNSETLRFSGFRASPRLQTAINFNNHTVGHLSLLSY